jgi:hypothetical protein
MKLDEFSKNTIIKLYKNPSSGRRLIPREQMYGRMDRRTILRTRLTTAYPCWALNSFPPSTTRSLVTADYDVAGFSAAMHVLFRKVSKYVDLC